jgi:hypothetical protein
MNRIGFTVSHRSLTLLIGLLLLSAAFQAPPIALAQTAGPMSPEERKALQPPAPPSPMDNVKKGFINLFKPDKNSNKNNADLPSNKQNPYGTTVPDIADPASDRSAPRPATAKPTEARIQEPEKPTAPARPPLISQPPLQNVKVAEPVVSQENPPVKLVTLDNPHNPLGFADAENRLNQIDALIKDNQLTQARNLLTPLKQWLVDSTEAHLGLHKALGNVSSARAQSELEKQLALQFALMRDKAMFLMGSINVKESNYKTAIKDLTEVIKSQPRSEMGLKSYQMLQEIGFTEKLQLTE